MDLTMNDRKKFALGILLGLVVVTLVAFVPSLTDFNSGQFATTGNKVTIADSVLLTNAGLKSTTVYQVDTNTVALRVFGYNSNGRTNMIQQWLAIPYPGGSPNVVASIDTNGVATFGGGVTAGPSAVRLTDTTTGMYWQWSELNTASNIIERLPTNGNNGLSWGIKMWTNVTVAADGTPTNQAMNFQLGTGLSVDWANRQITANSGAGGEVYLFPDGTTVTITNREYQSHWIQRHFRNTSTLEGSDNWRLLLSGGPAQSMNNQVGYPASFDLRAWATNTSGVALIGSGTSAGDSTFTHGSNSMESVTFNWYMNPTPIYQVTNCYSVVMGFMAAATFTQSGDPTNAGVYLLADTNSLNYQAVTLTNGVFTTNTIVANTVTANQRQWGGITWQQNSNVVFYINGSAVATNSTATQIPNGVPMVVGYRISCLSSNIVGSAAAQGDLFIGYTEFYQSFPNPR